LKLKGKQKWNKPKDRLGINEIESRLQVQHEKEKRATKNAAGHNKNRTFPLKKKKETI